MCAMYDKAGIRFLYPENWSLVDENVTERPRTVSLQSPDGAFWSLMVYDRGTDKMALLQETLGQMREEYASLESSVAIEQFEDIEATGYEMYFYCFDFLIAARAFVLEMPSGAILLLLWQAEDRDFAKCEPVFRAMTISLLRETLAA